MAALPAAAAPVATPVGPLSHFVRNGAAMLTPRGMLRLVKWQVVGVHASAWTPERHPVSRGFTATVTFRITPSDGAFGDGLAFVIQDAAAGTAALGGGGGDLGFGGDPYCLSQGHGIPDSLAVEVDTFQNSGCGAPGSTGDLGPNELSVQSRGRLPNSAQQQYSLGAVESPIPMADGAVHQLRVAYTPGRLVVGLDGQPHMIVVHVDLGSYLQLSQGSAFLGFTAANGEATETDDIMAIAFTPSNAS